MAGGFGRWVGLLLRYSQSRRKRLVEHGAHAADAEARDCELRARNGRGGAEANRGPRGAGHVERAAARAPGRVGRRGRGRERGDHEKNRENLKRRHCVTVRCSHEAVAVTVGDPLCAVPVPETTP